jgi:hypothetical protein
MLVVASRSRLEVRELVCRAWRGTFAFAASNIVLALFLQGGREAFALEPLEETPVELAPPDVAEPEAAPELALEPEAAAAAEPDREPAPAPALTEHAGPPLEVGLVEGPPEPPPPPATFDVMRNDDVVEFVRAEFGESTIVAAIEANATDFDVSPRVLVALKRAGVPDRVLEAMIAAERASRQIALAVTPAPEPEPPAAAAAPAGISPEAFARLSQTVEEIAARTSAPPPAPKPPLDEGVDEPDPVRAPRAWLVEANGRTVFAPSPAQVAHTEMKRVSATAIKTLQNLAGTALTFASPVLGSGLSGLFRGDDPAMTAVWALPGLSSRRVLPVGAVFEIDFANIPGIDPAQYRPAIVQLVPTNDNYRLVGAAKTSAENKGTPKGPIIEEAVETSLEPLARGRYRVTLPASIGAGEYALVLRPIVDDSRAGRRRRNNESSLGQLLGGAANEALYLTWDFAVRG